MEYIINIKKILSGQVKIEADSAEDAIKQADKRFNQGGEMLPEMEDNEPLMFDSDPAPYGVIGENLCLGDEVTLGGFKYKILPVYIGQADKGE